MILNIRFDVYVPVVIVNVIQAYFRIQHILSTMAIEVIKAAQVVLTLSWKVSKEGVAHGRPMKQSQCCKSWQDPIHLHTIKDNKDKVS